MLANGRLGLLKKMILNLLNVVQGYFLLNLILIAKKLSTFTDADNFLKKDCNSFFRTLNKFLPYEQLSYHHQQHHKSRKEVLHL